MYALRAHLRRARALRPHYSSSYYYHYYYYYIGFEFGRSHTLHTVSRKFPHHHHYYYIDFECGRSQTLRPGSWKQFPHHHHHHCYYRGFEFGRSHTLHPVSRKFPRTLPIRRQTLVPSGCGMAHCWDNQLHLKRWHRVSVVACKAMASG